MIISHFNYFLLTAVILFSSLEAGFAPPIIHDFSPAIKKNFSPQGVSSQVTGVSYYADPNGNYIMVYPELRKGVLESIQYNANTASWGKPKIVAANKKINALTFSKEALSPHGNYATTAWFLDQDKIDSGQPNKIFVALKHNEETWTALPSLVRNKKYIKLDVAVNSKGNVLVCWLEDFESPSLYFAYYDGKDWTENKIVSNHIDFISPILVTSLDNGNFVLSYTDSKGPVTTFFDHDLQKFNQKKQFNTSFPYATYMATNSNKIVSLVWIEYTQTLKSLILSFALFKNNRWSPVKKVTLNSYSLIQNRVNKNGDTVFASIVENKGIYSLYAVDSTTLKTTRIVKSKFELAYAASAIDDFGNAIIIWISKGIQPEFERNYYFNGREPFISLRKGYKGKWSRPKSLGEIDSPFVTFGLSIPTAPLFTKDGVSILLQGAYTSLKANRVTTNLYLIKGEALFEKNTFLLQQQRPLID